MGRENYEYTIEQIDGNSLFKVCNCPQSLGKYTPRIPPHLKITGWSQVGHYRARFQAGHGLPNPKIPLRNSFSGPFSVHLSICFWMETVWVALVDDHCSLMVGMHSLSSFWSAQQLLTPSAMVLDHLVKWVMWEKGECKKGPVLQ